MFNFPLVSVCIPAYNHEKYIQSAIKSIINQTYKNIELIVIDDGSTDKTWQKINELKAECEQRFVRVIFKTQKNRGTCRTLTNMYKICKGEFVFDVASDDLVESNTIGILCDFLNKNKEYVLAVGNNKIVDLNNQLAYWDEKRNLVYKKQDATYITFVDFLKTYAPYFDSDSFGSYYTLLKDNYIPNGYMIRKSIFSKIGYFTEKAPLEDWWLMLQLSKYGKLKYIDKVLYSYRWHNMNTVKNHKKMKEMAKKTIKYEQDLICHIKNYDEYLPDVVRILQQERRRLIYNLYFGWIKYLFSFHKSGKKWIIYILGIKIKYRIE